MTETGAGGSGVGERQDAAAPLTPRARAKARRRDEILVAAARLMARRGFHAVRLDDIGAEVGISGPGMYRYFTSKEDVLAEMLLDISRRLRDGGRVAVERADEPVDVLDALLGVHVDFVATEPDLISVQFRDLGSLPAAPRHEVRTLQREYAQLWVDALVRVRPELSSIEARAHVHAVFGLLNSSPRLPAMAEADLRRVLTAMASAALRS
ncbi:TetR/AcrR family transcriptional regulator [Dietzia maris]|uniref:TetR/AcrR family transcriptional regulator n=1 Tax=Dietzia maris TaxID=37915 RepID=A0AAE4U3Y2_9ACTN|nr:TetR/AcrR family transcriptional regulator [Dietzia maris]MDV6298242.1 TetR/AcrR family transcriptional regulator [Dietzia maris]